MAKGNTPSPSKAANLSTGTGGGTSGGGSAQMTQSTVALSQTTPTSQNPQNTSSQDKRYSDVNTVSDAIMKYAKVDKWNQNTAYQMGFNDDAQLLVENLAKGNYGLATTIAKQAVGLPNWNKYGAKFSDKQCQIMAKAAIDNNLVPHKTIFDANIGKSVAAQAAAKAAVKAAQYNAYSKNYVKSSTKVAVGSKVWDSKGKSGVIVGIITKSSGYVTVKYDDGSIAKQMAFNLKGADGNYLKKRPKN